MSAEVDTKIQAVRTHEPDWDLADKLWGGTRSMREAGREYLPRFDKERAEDYEVRLKGSFLVPMFRDACDDLASRPFSKEITLQGESNPDLFADIELDADGDGCTLTELGLRLFKDGLRYGAWHLLVDYTGDGTQSERAERDNETRPVFIPIPSKCLVGWRFEGGELVQLRYRVQSWEASDDAYGEEEVERVVVWTREGVGATVQTFKRTKATAAGSEWAQEDERKVQPAAGGTIGIPLVSCFFSEADGLAASSPLMDLAWKNVEHWQSASDQRNILKYSRTGILVIQGMDADGLREAGGISVGANQAFPMPQIEGKVYYAEHSGSAIEAGRKDLEDIKREAAEMGSRPMRERATVDTATGRQIDEDRSTSKLKGWIRGTELRLERAFELAMEWRGAADEIKDDFAVDIFSDFSTGGGAQDMQVLSAMQVAGQLSKRTLLIEAQRRGVLREELDPDEEIEQMDEEFMAAAGPDVSTPKAATGDSEEDPDEGEEPEVDEG